MSKTPRSLFEGDEAPSPEESASANPGYALGQLLRALETSVSHEDSEVREQARRKAESWTEVLQGMLSGHLKIGSRTPIAGTPGWVTPEVVTGGFTTGRPRAGGPLLEHERDLLARLGLPADDRARAALNGHFLGGAGCAELRDQLHNGCYRIDIPEEGALLVLTWLAEQGHTEAADALLQKIAPWLGRLRFYPIPHSRPLTTSSSVRLQPVSQTIQGLETLSEPSEELAQREALTVWAPLFDQLVALFLETVEGPLPTVATGADGRPVRRADGSWNLSGGWPCQVAPEGWRERAQAWLDEFRRLRATHRRCGRPDQLASNFGLLRDALQRYMADPASLDGRDVGRVRMVLAHVLARRGLPAGERTRALREVQARQAIRPTRQELGHLIADRLRAGGDDSVEALAPLLAPVTPDEAARFHLPAGAAIPETFREPLLRSLQAPVETLVEAGVLSSSEMLARVIPQMAAPIAAAGFADPDLRRLYGALHEAFQRRRSLLLLNLESQVRIDELPWVAAIAGFRVDNDATRAEARALLDRLVLLALTTFPQTLLPNKLLRELRTLLQRAGLDIPVVDEIAADIFMGKLTRKYLRAAVWSGSVLSGTLYERYYGISYARDLRGTDPAPTSDQDPIAHDFTELCHDRARIPPGPRKGGSVAHNGMIIEQEQILTTHNLAPLVGGLSLAPVLAPQAGDLARRCFTWICRQQQIQDTGWQTRLRRVKNTAYAWRQMIFFLSLGSHAALDDFLVWAEDHLAQQRPAFQERFRPALAGLVLAARGGSLDAQESGTAARRLLGWTTGTHWLLA